MGWLILIDASIVAFGFALWYWCLATYNRRRGEKALNLVETACAGRCKVSDKKWHNSNHLLARLAFSSHWFENARINIHLRPRALPLRWLHSLWRKHEETITFEADLDCSPDFRLQVAQHQWITHGSTKNFAKRDWELHRPGPIVLTTRSEWTEELSPVVNSLLTSRKHRLLSVRLRPESPHLAASLPLNALSDEGTAASFFKLLRALAAGASTHH